MEENLPSSVNEQELLDRAYEQALRAIEDGRTIDVNDLLDGRTELRAEVEELVRLAQQVSVIAPEQQLNLPDYTILSEIGRGGMGRVYLARQERLGGRLVAIKVLPPGGVLSAHARERFRAEANALGKLGQRNVVAIYDVIEHGDVLAYAMEWVDGMSLLQQIEVTKPQSGHRSCDPIEDDATATSPAIDPAFIARVGLEISRALSAAHQAGLLHRDVKPSNILLRRDGTPLLADFGLVRETDATIHTQTGQWIGTPAYAAPEQLRGEQDAIDVRTDVFGLGATLYHALALRLPFSGKTATEILRNIEAGRYRPLRRINPTIPRDLDTIVTKAMDPEPARRYATADELGDDLERLLNLRPIKAKPASLLSRAWKAARRNRLALAGAALGSTMTIMLAVLMGIYLLWVPGWIDRHVSDARMELLNPNNAELLWIALMDWQGDPKSWRNRVSQAVKALEPAIAHYDRVLWATRLMHEHRTLSLERDTIALAHDLLKHVADRTEMYRTPFEDRCEADPTRTHQNRAVNQSSVANQSRAFDQSRARKEAEAPHPLGTQAAQEVQTPAGAHPLPLGHSSDGLGSDIELPATLHAALEAVRRAAPTTANFAKHWLMEGCVPALTSEELRLMGRDDKRALGLFGFLCGDASSSLRAWRAGGFDLADVRDPLVDASLGQLHAQLDLPGGAYARLERAVESFPQAGFLHVGLASAAIQIGELDRAEQLLRQADSLSRHDTFDNLTRVWADYYAARAMETLQSEPRALESLPSEPRPPALYAKRQGSGSGTPDQPNTHFPKPGVAEPSTAPSQSRLRSSPRPSEPRPPALYAKRQGSGSGTPDQPNAQFTKPGVAESLTAPSQSRLRSSPRPSEPRPPALYAERQGSGSGTPDQPNAQIPELESADAYFRRAEQLYLKVMAGHVTWTGRQNYAAMLEQWGRAEEGLIVLQAAIDRRPTILKTRALFVDLAERWWAGLDGMERFHRIRKALDEHPQASGSLVSLLRTYHECKERLSAEPESYRSRAHQSRLYRSRARKEAVFAINRSPNSPNPTSPNHQPLPHGRGSDSPSVAPWLRGSVASSEFFPTLLAAFASPHLQMLSLEELATRMEEVNMDRLLKSAEYPKWFRSVQQILMISSQVKLKRTWLDGVAARVVAIFVSSMPAGIRMAQAGEFTICDQFDNGMLDPAWQVVFQDNAVGWTYGESESNLTVTGIEPIAYWCSASPCNKWGRVKLLQQVPLLSDFAVEMLFSWDSHGLNSAVQSLELMVINENDELIAEVMYWDAWYLTSGSRYALAGTNTYYPNPHWGELPLAGNETARITRSGDQIQVYWNDELLVIGTTSEPVQSFAIRFQYYAHSPSAPSCGDVCNSLGDSTFGAESIDWVCISGQPTCIVVPFGDIYPQPKSNGVVDVDDILRILDGFVDPESFPEADIEPCGGDGDVDVDDILAELDAFAGQPLCPDPCVP